MPDSGAPQGLHVEGTTLRLDGQPYYFQGLSFFNALYNPTFNRSHDDRRFWLRKFRDNGVNALRVFLQWDMVPEFNSVDATPDTTLYTPEGALRDDVFERIEALMAACDEVGTVLEAVCFKGMGRPTLAPAALERAVAETARHLRPHRRLLLQIWNEDSRDALNLYRVAKGEDPDRLVTNSPGGANVLGDDEQNRTLDLLTPHTIRYQSQCFWEEAPRQVASLLERFGKPVIDDEPARNGPRQYGGVEGGTRPEHHIEQIRRVRELGGYNVYHHDMFQWPGSAMTPPTGIPDPDFSPFHRQVFDYLREQPTW
jgi:hypothetical protein